MPFEMAWLPVIVVAETVAVATVNMVRRSVEPDTEEIVRRKAAVNAMAMLSRGQGGARRCNAGAQQTEAECRGDQ